MLVENSFFFSSFDWTWSAMCLVYSNLLKLVVDWLNTTILAKYIFLEILPYNSIKNQNQTLKIENLTFCFQNYNKKSEKKNKLHFQK